MVHTLDYLLQFICVKDWHKIPPQKKTTTTTTTTKTTYELLCLFVLNFAQDSKVMGHTNAFCAAGAQLCLAKIPHRDQSQTTNGLHDFLLQMPLRDLISPLKESVL